MFVSIAAIVLYTILVMYAHNRRRQQLQAQAILIEKRRRQRNLCG